MAAEKATLRKNITEILEEADLNNITAKKVRQQLETKLKTDLTKQKKEIDDMVMEILAAKQNEGDAEEASDEEEPKKQQKRGTKRKPAKDSEDEDEDSEDDRDKKKKKAKAPAKAGGAKKGGTGFTKLCKLSPELSKVMGEESMARHEVVKKMWAIIKEKNLYDPKNKQFAICNDELLSVFGVKRFRTFGMMKYLKNHFIVD